MQGPEFTVNAQLTGFTHPEVLIAAALASGAEATGQQVTGAFIDGSAAGLSAGFRAAAQGDMHSQHADDLREAASLLAVLPLSRRVVNHARKLRSQPAE